MIMISVMYVGHCTGQVKKILNSSVYLCKKIQKKRGRRTIFLRGILKICNRKNYADNWVVTIHDVRHTFLLIGGDEFEK